jgi:short subunit dehydrogenase-like uncharacterized protein
MRFWGGAKADDSGELGRRRHCVPFDRHSQHRGPFEASPAIRAFARTPWFVKSFLGLTFMQTLLRARVDSLPEGPSEAARRSGRAILVGVARNNKGEMARSRMRAPEGYSLTAASAFDAARRVAAGDIKPGFQTPSRAFGADYILSFDAVTREDLNN